MQYLFIEFELTRNCKILNLFYPTIVPLIDSNRPAVYTIAIYGRLYTAEWRQR